MIEFFNIRTGERRKVTSEPMLAAFYNSSDQGANSHEGQDFGWRVAPETIARMNEIKKNQATLDHIKSQFQLADEPKDTDILRWISIEEARKQNEQGKQAEGDFERQYQDDLRALKDSGAPAPDIDAGPETPPAPPADPTPPAAPQTPPSNPQGSKPSNRKKQSDNAKIEESKDNQEN